MSADGTRARVIFLFELYFKEWITKETPLQTYFNEILEVAKKQDVTLMCWCWPLPCHGDVIKRELEQRLTQSSH